VAGFAKTAHPAPPEDLAGAAGLELRLDAEVVPPFQSGVAEAAQALLPAIYARELVARLGPDGLVHVGQVVDGLRLKPMTPIELVPGPGQMICGGCGAVTSADPGGICFACDLGLDCADFPTRLLPHALALRAELGPAGGRGLRVAAIRARAGLDEDR
jgi:hypothetical protein